MFAGTGVMFLLASLFVFLPLIILSPSKFALTFSLGSGLILASLGALKGWRQMAGHMTAKERLPFTAGVLEGSGVRDALHVKLWEHNHVFWVVMIADAEARWGVESRSHALTAHPGCHPLSHSIPREPGWDHLCCCGHAQLRLFHHLLRDSGAPRAVGHMSRYCGAALVVLCDDRCTRQLNTEPAFHVAPCTDHHLALLPGLLLPWRSHGGAVPCGWDGEGGVLPRGRGGPFCIFAMILTCTQCQLFKEIALPSQSHSFKEGGGGSSMVSTLSSKEYTRMGGSYALRRPATAFSTWGTTTCAMRGRPKRTIRIPIFRVYAMSPSTLPSDRA